MLGAIQTVQAWLFSQIPWMSIRMVSSCIFAWFHLHLLLFQWNCIMKIWLAGVHINKRIIDRSFCRLLRVASSLTSSYPFEEKDDADAWWLHFGNLPLVSSALVLAGVFASFSSGLFGLKKSLLLGDRLTFRVFQSGEPFGRFHADDTQKWAILMQALSTSLHKTACCRLSRFHAACGVFFDSYDSNWVVVKLEFFEQTVPTAN